MPKPIHPSIRHVPYTKVNFGDQRIQFLLPILNAFEPTRRLSCIGLAVCQLIKPVNKLLKTKTLPNQKAVTQLILTSGLLIVALLGPNRLTPVIVGLQIWRCLDSKTKDQTEARLAAISGITYLIASKYRFKLLILISTATGIAGDLHSAYHNKNDLPTIARDLCLAALRFYKAM